ncbi:hypothetical protein Tco_1191226, partial [Tanacetum coccineum]
MLIRCYQKKLGHLIIQGSCGIEQETDFALVFPKTPINHKIHSPWAEVLSQNPVDIFAQYSEDIDKHLSHPMPFFLFMVVKPVPYEIKDSRLCMDVKRLA